MIVEPLYDAFFPRPSFLEKHDIKMYREHLKKLRNSGRFSVSKISQDGFKAGEMAIIECHTGLKSSKFNEDEYA